MESSYAIYYIKLNVDTIVHFHGRLAQRSGRCLSKFGWKYVMAASKFLNSYVEVVASEAMSLLFRLQNVTAML